MFTSQPHCLPHWLIMIDYDAFPSVIIHHSTNRISGHHSHTNWHRTVVLLFNSCLICAVFDYLEFCADMTGNDTSAL